MNKTIDIMEPDHPKWDEFCDKLSEAVFIEDGEEFKNICSAGVDKTHATAVLEDMNFDEDSIWASLHYFEDHGGFCDCEILMNVDRSWMNEE